MGMTREEAIAYLEQADTTVYKKIKTKTAEALEMAIKALEQTRWIPVSERLPELGEVVLIYDKAFGYLTAIYSEVVDDYNERIPSFSTHYSISSDKWAIMHPTAWMPLPEPYKAESEDDE